MTNSHSEEGARDGASPPLVSAAEVESAVAAGTLRIDPALLSQTTVMTAEEAAAFRQQVEEEDRRERERLLTMTVDFKMFGTADQAQAFMERVHRELKVKFGDMYRGFSADL